MFSPRCAFDRNGTITHQNTMSVRITAPALVCCSIPIKIKKYIYILASKILQENTSYNYMVEN